MSVAGLSPDPNRPCKNSLHWRNNSGELDVFEAARYFSGANENPGYNSSSMFSGNLTGENRLHGQRAARMSLDVPMIRNPFNSESFPVIQKQKKENKKNKQPSSPGGRLASFLNSLFNQTASKKKKKKPKSSTKDNPDHQEDQSPGGRKRRSSISHFRITTGSTNDSNSSSSGFVTPPTYAKTPTKSSYREFRHPRHHQEETHVLKNGANAEKRSTDYSWLDEEFRFSSGNIFKNGSNFRNSTTDWINAGEGEKGFRKFSDVDDGADTDSSSDLFDLPNYDLDLPVYGTTHVDRIRIGAPISSAATV